MANSVTVLAKSSKLWKNFSCLDSGSGGGQRNEDEKGSGELHDDEINY